MHPHGISSTQISCMAFISLRGEKCKQLPSKLNSHGSPIRGSATLNHFCDQLAWILKTNGYRTQLKVIRKLNFPCQKIKNNSYLSLLSLSSDPNQFIITVHFVRCSITSGSWISSKRKRCFEDGAKVKIEIRLKCWNKNRPRHCKYFTSMKCQNIQF